MASGWRQPQRVGPVGQACLALFLLDGHEEGVILQPEGLCLAKLLVPFGGGGQQPPGSFGQNQRALEVQLAVLDGLHRLGRGQFGFLQISLPGQQAEVDEIGIPCKGGKL